MALLQSWWSSEPKFSEASCGPHYILGVVPGAGGRKANMAGVVSGWMEITGRNKDT